MKALMIRCAVVSVFLAGAAAQAWAGQVMTYQFEGQVTNSTLSGTPVGSSIEGTFSYELDSPIVDDNGSFTTYRTGAVAFQTQGVSYTSTLLAPSTRVFNDYHIWPNDPYLDGLYLRTHTDDNHSAFIQLYSYTSLPSTTFTSTSLPAFLPLFETFTDAGDKAYLQYDSRPC